MFDVWWEMQSDWKKLFWICSRAILRNCLSFLTARGKALVDFDFMKGLSACFKQLQFTVLCALCWRSYLPIRDMRITTKAPSTLIRFQTKTELVCSEYGYRPHYNAENDHRKRSHSKTLSRVERFENDAFWKRCFLVWTEKTMLSENGDVIRIDTTGRQTTRPWVSKMADRRYHVASISRQFHRPMYWNAHVSSIFEHAHLGYKSVFKTDTAL